MYYKISLIFSHAVLEPGIWAIQLLPGPADFSIFHIPESRQQLFYLKMLVR
jgi:hypothetical protein